MNTGQAARTMALVLACVATISVAPTAAQSEFTRFELTTSPYVLAEGNRDNDERSARRERLAVIAEAAGDHARAARHYLMSCQNHVNGTGDRTLSHPSCERARALARDHGVADVTVGLQQVEATLRAWQFDFEGAIKLLREIIANRAALNPDVMEGTPLNSAHQMLGSVLSERGQFGEAQRELTFARDHCRISGSSGCVLYAEIYLCRHHTTLGDYGAARTACDTAVAVAAIHDDVVAKANLFWMRGTLEAALNRHEAALAEFEKAWQAAQVKGTEILRPILAGLITHSLIVLGRLDHADQWQHNLDQWQKDGRVPFWFAPQIAMTRGELALAHGRLDEALPAFAIGSKSILQEMSISGYLAMALVSKQRGDLPGAREAVERAIAKIETSRTNVDGSALRATYLTLHAKAYGELVGLRWDADGAAAAGDALQIAEKGRARSLLDALASAQVVGAAAPTLDAKAVQATLGNDDVLVEYVSLENRLFAITVTRDRIRFTALPGAGTAAELARRVDFFSALVQESDEAAFGHAAGRLYADVLAPALADLPASAHTLIIAADGPLHRLPFDALGEPRVVDRWDVVTLPSASAMAQRSARAKPSAAALVVAVPEASPGLSALPGARAEAAAIRQRVGGEVSELTGTGATRQGLEKLGPGRFAVLHFASHAVVDEVRPLRSALMLTPGAAGAEGRWTAEDIYRSNLVADLVVLSACSTAAGATTPGEGVMSLARAFLYAGANSTIATLWDVPDAPGPVFADILYRRLAAGRPLGEATAEARRELRRRGAPPRAWAAYVLTGNPKATVGVKPRTDTRLVTAGVAGGLSAVLLLAALIIVAARGAWRIRWQAPAIAGAGLAIIAIVVQPFPWREARLDLGSREDRGMSRLVLTPTIYQGRLTWSPVPGADEHLVEMFDNAGVPVGSPVATTSPFELPAAAAGGWIRIGARNHSQLMTRSSLVPVP